MTIFVVVVVVVVVLVRTKIITFFTVPFFIHDNSLLAAAVRK